MPLSSRQQHVPCVQRSLAFWLAIGVREADRDRDRVRVRVRDSVGDGEDVLVPDGVEVCERDVVRERVALRVPVDDVDGERVRESERDMEAVGDGRCDGV